MQLGAGVAGILDQGCTGSISPKIFAYAGIKDAGRVPITFCATLPLLFFAGKNMFRKLLKKRPEAERPLDPLTPAVTCETLPEVESDIDGMLLSVPELMREGVWVMEGPDFSGNSIIKLSPRARNLLGMALGTPHDQSSLTSLMSNEDKEAFRLYIRRVVSNISDEGHTLLCRLNTGGHKSEWFSIRAKHDSRGTTPNVTGTLEKIDDQVEQAHRFDIVSTRFDLSREMLNDGLWDLDILNGDPMNPRNVFWWSPQFRKLLGFETVEEFPDVMESWSSRLHPEDKQNALDSFVKHLLDRSGQTGFDIEYRLKLRTGEYRWFQARGQTKRSPDGTPLRAVGALIDIQNRKDRMIHQRNEVQRREQTTRTADEIAELVAENGDIAAQIKIISLNASIEAARAGVHGRGFSVIASAIRVLAERTADITGQISRLQMRIRNSSGDSD